MQNLKVHYIITEMAYKKGSPLNVSSQLPISLKQCVSTVADNEATMRMRVGCPYSLLLQPYNSSTGADSFLFRNMILSCADTQ